MQAFGYLFVFMPFVLLVIGQFLDEQWLAFFVVFGVGPLSRFLLGNTSERPTLWSERVASILDLLPVVYAVFAAAALTVSITFIQRYGVGSQPLLFGASLWTCCFFAVVVAHELIHQRGWRRRLGAFLAGAAGYPWLAQEHLMHHSVSGNVELAEWPRLNESVWQFAARRTQRVVRSAIQYNAMQAARRNKHVVLGGLGDGIMATVFMAAAFCWAAGPVGILLYAAVIAGVHFGVQAVTYLQHWGLGEDSIADADAGQYAWEDRCRFQGWLMLNMALHQTHHRDSRLPFYRVVPRAGSPRLPAGYVILLMASFFPPLWRWLMLPALNAWKVDPLRQVEPQGWRLVCLPRHFPGA